MTYADSMSALRAKRNDLLALHGEIRELQKKVEPQPVEDYVFEGWSGPVRLSELFGDKRDLFVIHNMGTTCRYCTMWADGFNGVYDHLADRAAFALASPNTTDVQKQFARSRGWRFPMVSHAGSNFTRDMGYRLEKGDEDGEDRSRWVPGVSVFQKRADGSIVRVSDTDLGPHDDFCSVWHFLDMLPEGDAGWEPKFRYG
ncbi:MAG TPA: DUF899 family protein [Caulobacteraceae bacterium]|jgi:predicted dithiol-disulfide oxidoreductase (DUF899 family)